MKINPAGDANRAITLQALRAGPMTATEMAERWSFGSGYAYELKRAGLVEIVGDEFRLTPAGRAACPCRNPLAAQAATPPEVFTMPKGKTHVTRQQVLAVILAGGANGATRKALIEKFADRAKENAIDMHIAALNLQMPPVIFKPKPGVMVGIEFQQDTQFEAAPGAAETAPETASTATEDWIPEPLATDWDQKVKNLISALSLATEAKDAAEARVKALERLLATYNAFRTRQARQNGLVPGGLEHRILIALRAPPGLTSDQLYARFDGHPSGALSRLRAAGLVTPGAGKKGELVSLTDAGRQAVDPAGPLARSKTLINYCHL